MMIVEKFSSHSHTHSHSFSYHHKDKDTESEELMLRDVINKSRDHHHHSASTSNAIMSFMIGLLTHSAVDGIALGAVSAEGNARSLSVLVFIALMAHKGPAAISMTAFLKRKLKSVNDVNKNKKTIIKQLVAFSCAAPLFSILTFVVLNSITYFVTIGEDGKGMDDLLGYCLLFSGGTFLYVVTLHIIPEIKEWRSMDGDDHSHGGLRWIDLLILSVGCVVPSLFEHSH